MVVQEMVEIGDDSGVTKKEGPRVTDNACATS